MKKRQTSVRQTPGKPILCRRQKKTQDLTTMNERVCIVRGERDEGRERSKRDTELRRFALCTHSFPWRLTRSVVSCRILRCKHRRRSYQATRERYSRKAWNDIGSDGTYTHTHTHARGHALSLRFAPRARLVSRCVRATEKQHPASFSVLVTPSSSNARGQCTLFFSHARFLFRSSFLYLSRTLSPARLNGKQTKRTK